MRLNWMIQDNHLHFGTIHEACGEFIKRHKTVPDTVKISLQDFNCLLGNAPAKLHFLESGKKYGQFVAIAGGMVELILQTDEETVATSPSTSYNSHGNLMSHHVSMLIVESSQLDREFEKHVLNKEE